MKIIEVVQHLAPGGIETLVLELQQVYSKVDQVIIISLEGQEQQAMEKWHRLTNINCTLIFLDKRPGIQLGVIRQLTKIFKTNRPDAVHTHHIGPLLYAGIAARHAGIHSVTHTEHDVWHLQTNRKRFFLQRVLLQYVKPTLVADATYVSEALTALFPKYKNQIITNGINIDTFYPSDMATARKALTLEPLSNVKLIGCAARLVEGKGHTYLIEALSNLPSNVHLVLAGDGPLRKALEDQCESLGLSKRVYFLGNVDQMANFYRALDLFCLPSEAEGLPLSPLEAQACNIPVVVTNVGGCKEAVCPNTGILIPAKDANILTLALTKGLSKKSINFTSRPRDFVTKERSHTSMASMYRALMQEKGEKKWL
ncbi:glycosyltransferase [Marinomonas algicola]|uniref:glycosyltransferase n=1 Tax=Marinomonas algicola TaxID=2773454 RepID=UPI00174C3B61|nr:glycosyltransferase [Marinomonas algicola]